MNFAPLVRFKETYDDGTPLANGKLWTYQAGSTTPLATYIDMDGNVNDNPVILDARGEADVLIGDQSYKFQLLDENDNLIWERDNISIPQVQNGFSTGDIKFALKTIADTGWVLMDDKSIGSATSGATGRANADTQSLFNLLWTNVSNANAPVSGGRGATAALDWAADKTLTLPRALGRALAVYGTGSGLTARSLGETLGVEVHILTEAQLPVITVTQVAHNHAQDPHKHQAHPAVDVTAVVGGGGLDLNNNVAGYQDTTNATATNQATTATNNPFGGGASHPNMQPTLFLNAMIKL